MRIQLNSSAFEATAPRRAAVFVVAERPDAAAALARLVAQSSGFAPTVLDGGLAAARSLRGLENGSVVLVALGGAPTARARAEIVDLARASAVIVVAARDALAAFEEAAVGRAVGLLDSADLAPSALESALRAQMQKRRREDRLIGLVAERNERLAALAAAAAQLERSAAEVAAEVDALLKRLATRELRPETEAAVGAVADATGNLRAAAASLFAAGLSPRVEAAPPRPADLNGAIEAVVKECEWSGVTGVSAMTSAAPIPLDVEDGALLALLRALVAAWRADRRDDDRLEFLAWEGGAGPELAAILQCGVGAPHAAAADRLTALQAAAESLCDACGATTLPASVAGDGSAGLRLRLRRRAAPAAVAARSAAGELKLFPQGAGEAG